MSTIPSTARLRKLRQVKPGDVVQGFAAVWAATRVEWGLRRRSLPETAASLGLAFDPMVTHDAKPAAEREPLDLPDWAWRRAHIGWLTVKHWPFGDTCLRRALVMGNRLKPFDPQLVVGVRVSDGSTPVDAHAWVRIGDTDLDPLARDYLVFGGS